MDHEFGSFTTGIGRFEVQKVVKIVQIDQNGPWIWFVHDWYWTVRGSKMSETHTIDTSGPPYPVGVI